MSVVGDFDLNDAERELFGTEVLRLRKRTIGGDSPVLQVETLAAEDARLRDYADLTVPQLKDRFETLELSQAGLKVKTDYIAQLDAAASAAPQVVVWARATAQMEKALPVGKRFDAAGAYDVEDAIRTTLQTAYKAHLNDDELTGTVRTIETQIEKKLVGDIAAIRDHVKSKVADIGEIDIQPVVSFGSANGLKATTITITNQAGDGVNLRLSGAGRGGLGASPLRCGSSPPCFWRSQAKTLCFSTTSQILTLITHTSAS
ncbi:hypothetical protein [Microbacterium sp. USHLN186]|uniref:hypothetical protein n=1 Tax=Microbacterium sp. USHLN186 TaxID=3081286 RepID=UPI003017283B